MEPLPCGRLKIFFLSKKQTSGQLISQSNELANTVAKSPFSEWPRGYLIMAASVDRVARLVSRTPLPAPRACVNDFPSDDALAAAHRAYITRVSANFLRNRRTKITTSTTKGKRGKL
jgi:hypothetical protein